LQRAGKSQPPFDAVLKRGLDGQRSPGAECPDAQTLAAYCERALPAAQSARSEEHFSNCARCQGALAAIARARTPDRAAARSLTTRRWELYAALAAGVAGISIVATLMRSARRPLSTADTLSRNEVAAPAQVHREAQAKARDSRSVIALNEPARPPTPPSEPGSADQPEPEAVTGFGSSGIPTEITRPSTTGQNSVVNEEARPQLLAKRMRLGMERRKEPAVHGPPAMRAFVKSAQAAGTGSQQQLANAEAQSEAEGAPAAPPPPPPAPVAGRGSAASNAPSVPISAPAGGSAGALYAPSDISEQGLPQSVSIRTADGVERWRLGANGTIEHVASDGQWTRQDSGVTIDLSAGAAPSSTVCWAVGAGGTVLRTTDGEHWQKLASPTPVNLAAVSAHDAVSAVVTTAGGQRFATTDGGRTWRPM